MQAWTTLEEGVGCGEIFRKKDKWGVHSPMSASFLTVVFIYRNADSCKFSPQPHFLGIETLPWNKRSGRYLNATATSLLKLWVHRIEMPLSSSPTRWTWDEVPWAKVDWGQTLQDAEGCRTGWEKPEPKRESHLEVFCYLLPWGALTQGVWNQAELPGRLVTPKLAGPKLQWGTISHRSEWPSLTSQQITNAGESVEKREPSYTVGGNVSWYNHYGEHYGSASENYT